LPSSVDDVVSHLKVQRNIEVLLTSATYLPTYLLIYLLTLGPILRLSALSSMQFK